MITYYLSVMYYRGALPFPETQNKAKKLRKTHPKFSEIGEIASEDGRKVIDQEKTMKMI
jgi:hypothetical protein